MDGYIRVSRRMGREGPGYISPDVQRDAIQRWADYRGVEIVTWHVDEDQSGGTQNRPGMRAFMERMEADETDGIAVWKLDRFARNVHEAIGDVKAMHARGKHLAAVTEDIDPTGPFGSFILTVMLAVATLQRDSLVESWKIAKGRAMDRGAKIGPTPFGYVRLEDGTLEAHPQHAAIVAEAFTRAARDGLAAALSYLHAEAGSDRVWTMSTVRRFLANRSYLGELRYADDVRVDSIPQLVPRATWEAAQADEPKRRRPAAHFPLSGLATCAACGGPMVGGRGGKDRKTGHGLRTYRCAASLTAAKKRAARGLGEVCPSPSNTVAGPLEEYVRHHVAAMASGLGVVMDAGLLDDELAGLELALREAEAELDAFVADTSLRALIGPERYADGARARVEALEDVQAAYRAKASQAARAGVQADLSALVREAEGEELAELLRGALDRVEVTRGRGPIDGRVRLVMHDDEPPSGMATTHDPEGGGLQP
jgi:site-specific DNA recombinase